MKVRENWTYDANFSNETNYTDSGMAFSAGCAGVRLSRAGEQTMSARANECN